MRHLEAGHVRQLLHGLDETHVFVVHQETDGRAVGAAAKAVIELLVGADGEGRRLFAMEWATGLVLVAGFFQWHTRVDDLNDIATVEYVIYEPLGD